MWRCGGLDALRRAEICCPCKSRSRWSFSSPGSNFLSDATTRSSFQSFRSTRLFPAWNATSASSFALQQKRFFYYRFHKRVGFGKFSRYTEFYVRPRSIENTQRLRFNYAPTFSASKASSLWSVFLNKRLAAARDAEEVLQIWDYYRKRRPKKPFHVLGALQRLVELGAKCPSDRRFQVIVRDALRLKKRFANVPRLCVLLSRLKACGALSPLFRILMTQDRRLAQLGPSDLVNVASACGFARLQHKRILDAVASAVLPYLPELQNSQLVALSRAFAATQLHHYGLLASVSTETVSRVNSVNGDAQDVRVTQGMFDEDGKSDSQSAGAKDTQRRPSITQLVDIGEAFAILKFRDWHFFDVLSSCMQTAMEAAPDGSAFASLAPSVLGRGIDAFRRLKINDVALAQAAMKTLLKNIHDASPDALCLVGRFSTQVLPPGEPEVQKTHEAFAGVLREMTVCLSLEELAVTAEFVDRACLSKDFKLSVLERLKPSILKMDKGSALADVPKLTEILFKNQLLDESTTEALCRLSRFAVSSFEPQDASRMARVLVSLIDLFSNFDVLNSMKSEAPVGGCQRRSLASALATNICELYAQFSPPDLAASVKNLTESDLLDRRKVVGLRRALKMRKGDLSADEASEDGEETCESQSSSVLRLGRKSELTDKADAALSPSRNRYRHRRRILEREGWNLLHRRVAAVGELPRLT